MNCLIIGVVLAYEIGLSCYRTHIIILNYVIFLNY